MYIYIYIYIYIYVYIIHIIYTHSKYILFFVKTFFPIISINQLYHILLVLYGIFQNFELFQNVYIAISQSTNSALNESLITYLCYKFSEYNS